MIYARSVECDADPLVVAPHRMAAPRELVGGDHQREGSGQADRIDNLDARAGIRHVADHAIDGAAAVERQPALLQHPVPGCDPFLVCLAHGRNPMPLGAAFRFKCA